MSRPRNLLLATPHLMSQQAHRQLPFSSSQGSVSPSPRPAGTLSMALSTSFGPWSTLLEPFCWGALTRATVCSPLPRQASPFVSW